MNSAIPMGLAALMTLMPVLAGGICHGAASSPQYRLERDLVGSAGGASASSGYRNIGVLGGPAASLKAQSANYRLHAGAAQPYPAFSLFSLRLLLLGSGSVNSIPAGIACTGGACSFNFPRATVVTLMPAAGADSRFSGWSGACVNNTGNCQVAMVEANEVTASFSPVPALRLVGSATGFSDLQAAYDAAASGTQVHGRAVVLVGDFVAAQAKTVVIKGGYDSDFSRIAGATVLDGVLHLRAGRVIASGLKVR